MVTIYLSSSSMLLKTFISFTSILTDVNLKSILSTSIKYKKSFVDLSVITYPLALVSSPTKTSVSTKFSTSVPLFNDDVTLFGFVSTDFPS